MKNRKLLLNFLLFAFISVLTVGSLSAGSSALSEEASSEDWTMIGPDNVSGRVRTAMFDRYNYGVVYAGTATGLYVSVNNGKNWREIKNLGSGHEAVTAIVQDDNGVIYIGTGEGYYNIGMHAENHLGRSDEPTGRIGSGVYRSNTLEKEWTASLSEGSNAQETDDIKYEWICNNISFTQIENTKTNNRYNDNHQWAYINAMTYADGTVYVGTKNSGLYAINTSDNSVVAVPVFAAEIHDVVVNPNGKVALSFDDGIRGSNIAVVEKNGSTFSVRTIFTIDSISATSCGRVKLAFGTNNPDNLYAYIATRENSYSEPSAYTNRARAGSALGIYKTTSTDEGQIAWSLITNPNNYTNGNQHAYAMSLAVDDRDGKESIYAGSNRVMFGEDESGSGTFYFTPWTSPMAERGTNFVPANVHAILFMPNPKDEYDEYFQLYATDAGVYTYNYEPILKTMVFTPGKYMNNVQTYKVTASADGSVMAAAQSNAMIYIPTPSDSVAKSAQHVWAVNSPNYPLGHFVEDVNEYFADQYPVLSNSGVNVIASSVLKSYPESGIRKPFFIARPYLNVARTYSNRGVFDEIETETTWNFGGLTTSDFDNATLFMSPSMYPNNPTAPIHNSSQFATPIAYWENFGDNPNVFDSTTLTVKNGSTIIRNGKSRVLNYGDYVKRGDSLLVSDNAFLGYPFKIGFDDSYQVEGLWGEPELEVIDGELVVKTPDTESLFVFDTVKSDSTKYQFRVLPKIQTRLAMVTPEGVFVTPQALDFTRRVDNSVNSQTADVNKYLVWRRVFSTFNADLTSGGLGGFNPNGLNNTIRNIAFSSDGSSLFLSMDVYNDGTGTDRLSSYDNYLETRLIRVDGLNDTSLSYYNYKSLDLNDGGRFGGRIGDAISWTKTTIGTFNRHISSIVSDPKNANNLVVTFDGFDQGNNVIYYNNALAEVPSYVPLAKPEQSDKDYAPVYTALIEKGSNTLFVGTDEGIYKMENFTQSSSSWVKDGDIDVPVYHIWQQIQNHPQVKFTDVSSALPEEVTYSAVKNAGYIYAATYGRGVYMNTAYKQENSEDEYYVALSDVKHADNVASLSLYPNPTTNITTIAYTLQENSSVMFNIYDMNGRLVSSLDKGRESKGSHSQILDASNMNKGVYVIQMITNTSTRTGKLVVE